MLLEKGADLNVQVTGSGLTLLYSAAQRGKKQTVEMILTHGAYINAKDRDGNTPLVLAQKADHTEIVSMLRKQGARE